MVIYKLYGFLHKTAKRILTGNSQLGSKMQFVYLYSDKPRGLKSKSINGDNIFINDKLYQTSEVITPQEELFYGENLLVNAAVSDSELPQENTYISRNTEESWMYMLQQSQVPQGWKNTGFHSTGYILEKENWCLSSWIWTSAAVARCYIEFGNVEDATRIADCFVRDQLECGGWLVRYDFSSFGAIPIIAPNDSAYIANNALLTVYKTTKDENYLIAAEKCAKWIMRTAREDGLVYVGCDNRNGKWIKNINIVDIGFTAGLFAILYEITKKDEYKDYMSRFVTAYIKAFYNANLKAFSTSIDANDKQQGGVFGRGQAWALEGLIPAYDVLRTEELRVIIDNSIAFLVKNQKTNGGWPYNFRKTLMGEDCKGISVLAKSILDWYSVTGNEKLLITAVKALEWCKQHTKMSGGCIGGIFSYSIEGAVVHDLYTQTAFTYASAYALEVSKRIREIKGIDISK